MKKRLCAALSILALTAACVVGTAEGASATRNPKPWCHPCKGITP